MCLKLYPKFLGRRIKMQNDFCWILRRGGGLGIWGINKNVSEVLDVATFR